MTRLKNDRAYVESISNSGAEKALEIASKNMDAIKAIVGLK